MRICYTDWDDHAELPDYRTIAQAFRALRVWMVGVQTPSVASLADRAELTDVHQTLLRAEIVIVESLANLRDLPAAVTFVALPLKIDGGQLRLWDSFMHHGYRRTMRMKPVNVEVATGKCRVDE